MIQSVKKLGLPFLCICSFMLSSYAHSSIKEKAQTVITHPNIPWITIEDWSPDLSCYGTKGIYTPYVGQLTEMSILYLKEKLIPEQAAFFAPIKLEIGLYDLQNDTYEVFNVADNPEYASVKKVFLAELHNWRSNTIKKNNICRIHKR